MLEIIYLKVLDVYKDFSHDASATVAIKKVDDISETLYVSFFLDFVLKFRGILLYQIPQYVKQKETK